MPKPEFQLGVYRGQAFEAFVPAHLRRAKDDLARLKWAIVTLKGSCRPME